MSCKFGNQMATRGWPKKVKDIRESHESVFLGKNSPDSFSVCIFSENKCAHIARRRLNKESTAVARTQAEIRKFERKNAHLRTAQTEDSLESISFFLRRV